MTTRDIQAHLHEIYEVEVSPELISRVTDAVHEEVLEWRCRPLERVYPIVYLLSESEGANFWFGVLTDLKNHSVHGRINRLP